MLKRGAMGGLVAEACERLGGTGQVGGSMRDSWVVTAGLRVEVG